MGDVARGQLLVESGYRRPVNQVDSLDVIAYYETERALVAETERCSTECTETLVPHTGRWRMVCPRTFEPCPMRRDEA